MRFQGLKYSLLLCLCLFGSKTQQSAANIRTYWTRPGLKIASSRIADQVTGIGKIACATICLSRPPCRSVSWSDVLQQCLISLHDVSKVWQLRLPSTSTGLEVASEWITMPINFPVIMYEGAQGGYTLTFSDAARICSSQNTSLATPAQLLEARGMGFEECACGWLSDGSAGYVMQQWINGCAYSDGIVVCPWTPLRNAWCMLE